MNNAEVEASRQVCIQILHPIDQYIWDLIWGQSIRQVSYICSIQVHNQINIQVQHQIGSIVSAQVKSQIANMLNQEENDV